MQIGIDIDDTITALPEFFKVLTASFSKEGHKIHIVTSRTENDESRKITSKELKNMGIVYHHLYFLSSISIAEEICPHKDLDWYQKYLWQKVNYCLENGVSVYFDDDEKVIALFKKYAPAIRTLKIAK